MYGLYNDSVGFSRGGMMGWFGGGIMMIVVSLLFVALIVWIMREVGGKNSHSNSNNAINILKERYSKGEINKEEFEAKKKDLNSF